MFTPRDHLGSLSCSVGVPYLFSFLSLCVCFVFCLRPMSCVPMVACVSALCILDAPFSNVY
jgi:hypothetical protein